MNIRSLTLGESGFSVLESRTISEKNSKIYLLVMTLFSFFVLFDYKNSKLGLLKSEIARELVKPTAEQFFSAKNLSSYGTKSKIYAEGFFNFTYSLDILWPDSIFFNRVPKGLNEICFPGNSVHRTVSHYKGMTDHYRGCNIPLVVSPPNLHPNALTIKDLDELSLGRMLDVKVVGICMLFEIAAAWILFHLLSDKANKVDLRRNLPREEGIQPNRIENQNKEVDQTKAVKNTKINKVCQKKIVGSRFPPFFKFK